MQSKLPYFAFIFLIISAVDSNRNLPSAAIFGSPLIFYFLFAALFFLFPTGLVSAELSSTHPDKQGVYHWVRHAFGDKWGMIAIWLQWINTVVWVPTILSFIAGSLAFIIDPALMENKIYMMIAIAAIFWGLTILNLFGIHISAHANSYMVIIGTLIPICLLIVLGAIWFIKEPLQLSLSLSSIVPKIGKFDTWVALIAVIGSFTGMELSGVHVQHVSNPRKTYPRALFIATLAILSAMLLGSLILAEILPRDKINLAGGMMQVFAAFFSAFQINYLTPIISLMIVVGSIGGLINWIISPSKGLLFAAEHGFLPPFFAQKNIRGVPSRILIIQAVLVTCICSLILFVPSVNAFYWLLTALGTGLYMLMYLLMFFSALSLRKLRIEHKHGYIIPGGNYGLGTVCLFGVIGSLLTFFFSFVPPPNINVGSTLSYFLTIAIGNLVFILPVFLTFLYKYRKNSL